MGGDNGSARDRPRHVCSIAPGEVECPFVDVNRPDRPVGLLQAHRKREGTPATPKIEEVSAGRRGDVIKQNRCPQVEGPLAKYARGSLEVQVESRKGHMNRKALIGTRG
jgi:hypothetical protein